jgi:hypothetical protein
MPLPSLSETLKALRRFARVWPTAIEVRPVALQRQMQNFNTSQVPSNHRQDAARWRQALAEGTLRNLPPAVSRRLAWEPAVGLETSYLKHLREQGIRVVPRIQRGLLFCVASRWDELQFAPDRLQELCHGISALFVQHDLPIAYPFAAAELVNLPLAIAQQASEMRLLPAASTKLLLGIQANATALVTASTLEILRMQAHLALSEEAGDRDYFYRGLMMSLVRPHVLPALRIIAAQVIDSGSVMAQGALRQLILRHPDLGDPRLPTTGTYWDRTDPLRTKVATWLSSEDIALFFRVFFHESGDLQGRKNFWLPYAGSVEGVRVVYCPADAPLVDDLVNLHELSGLNIKMFAKLTERTDAVGSAFIMHFRSAAIVEFSRINSATYLYDRSSQSSLIKDDIFWESEEFALRDLKNMRFATSHRAHRSRGSSWQDDFAQWLRGYGILPEI